MLLIILLANSVFASDEHILEEIEILHKKNTELFIEVKLYIDELLQKEKESLKKLDLDSDSGVKDIRQGLDRAYKIAKLNGLRVEKLKSLYELSKRVVLRSDFVKQNSKQAINTANSFQQWFDLTNSSYVEIQEEKARAQARRVVFYKKITLQYIKALTTKDVNSAYIEFKKYVNALRQIQSADAQQLIAQAEMLVAEQKLVADLSSTLPGVGEALDITMIVMGKDLSGVELSGFARAFALIALVTPEVLTQTIKRNPAVAKALGKMGATLKELPKKTLQKVKSQKALKQYLQSMANSSDEVLRWRSFYRQKIDEARKLASMSKSTRLSEAKKIEENLGYVYKTRSNLGNEMGQKISQTAKKRDEIIITRPTSDDLPQRLREGAHTKGMNVKGKSADSGIASGYVPTKQKFSKLDKSEEIVKFQAKVDKSLQTEVINGVEITPQRVKSKQLIVEKNEIRLEAVELLSKESQDSIAVFKTAAGKFVDENLKEIPQEVLKKYDIKNVKPFEVLTDMNGNYLTGDIDLLAVGSKKRATIVQNDVLMGNVNSHEMGTITEINRALKSKEHPDRLLVHHGGENSFMSSSSKLDFPLTAYSPDGKIAVLKNEKEVKEYFHMQKLKGYDLQPNPYWGWGKYDPKEGYQ